MDRYRALHDAMQKCGDDPHRIIGMLEAAGFDVVARNRSRKLGIASEAVRLAIDAHSPLPHFFVGQIVDWVNVNRGPMPTKAVYNAIAYLNRCGEIEQLGRGCYRCTSGGSPE